MKDLDKKRKQAFEESLAKKYSGCVFDIDGTLIVHCEMFIPEFVSEILSKLCFNVPLAVCTGRNLQLAQQKMESVFESSSDTELCKKNWHLICENGCIGYFYDPEQQKYKEFYRISFPFGEAYRNEIFYKLGQKMKGKLGGAFMNQVSMVFGPINYYSKNKSGIADLSRELQHIALKELEKLDPEGLLKVADAGMAITIFPADGNKERGTVEFAKYLNEKRGITIDKDTKDLVVIGDQPGLHGNDEAFLDGRFGTPFTVGEVHPNNLLPLPVYNPEKEAIMKGPKATVSLLKQLKFNNLLSL
jgi:hydroxymethylpyrimidine pyrophosphatase-like HAD family hydrolase